MPTLNWLCQCTLDSAAAGSKKIRYYDKVGGSYVNQTDTNNPFSDFVIAQANPVFTDRDGDGGF